MGTTPGSPLDERKLEHEIADRKRELDIKEREVTSKEREVSAKEIELKRSRWLNPTVIGLFAATLGLIGSVVVARVNNSNTQDVQRLQSEANITLEAIRTGTGNIDAACKNLMFFVSLGLVRDPEGKIKNQCKGVPAGPPSLPTNQANGRAEPLYLRGIVVDDARRPIAGAEVTSVSGLRSEITGSMGEFALPLQTTVSQGFPVVIQVTKSGFLITSQNVVASSEQVFVVVMRKRL